MDLHIYFNCLALRYCQNYGCISNCEVLQPDAGSVKQCDFVGGTTPPVAAIDDCSHGCDLALFDMSTLNCMLTFTNCYGLANFICEHSGFGDQIDADFLLAQRDYVQEHPINGLGPAE